jgi:hypothetical protein
VRQIDFGDWRGPHGPVNTISDEEIDHKRWEAPKNLLRRDFRATTCGWEPVQD